MAVFNKKQGLALTTLMLAGGMAFAKKAEAPSSPDKNPKSEIYERSAESIVKNFMFVGDFEQKEETRPNSQEIFWRYPSTLPKVQFALDMNEDWKSTAMQADFPATEGEGRPYQHINRGRVLFLSGDVDEARKTWLSGRARYGRNYSAHRRADYFIAQAFLYQGWLKWKQLGKNYQLPEVRQDFVNASTFFAWAFDRKRDIPDPLVESVSPRAFYNQSVIYFNYSRWAAVSGSIANGLDFLRRTGRREYRREFRRMMAELHIRNRSYLEAVQELDMTLRQDHDMASSAAIFARVGDIYYDLNNFELAEEVYAAANKIDRDHKYIRPSQYILRGESLFWLGRFEEARRTMQYALHASGMPQAIEDLDISMQALASLRIADSWLAQGKYESAKLAYFQHGQEFRGHITEKFAKIRLACLELPEYEGNNVRHARELLEGLKDEADSIPAVAQEMAWTCETASYAQHERTPEMVEKVRAFAQHYPASKFLQKLADPIREVQSRKIEDYFNAGNSYGAIQFFEKTRAFMFPKISEKLAIKLFSAYVEINQAQHAEEFLDVFQKSKLNDLAWLQLATALVELIDQAKGQEKEALVRRNREVARELERLEIRLPLEKHIRLYLHRIMNHSEGFEHFPWILAQGLNWLESDISIGCDIVYPLLQKIQENEHFRVRLALDQMASYFIDSNLKDLLRFETSCAYSLMSFEIGIHRRNLSELGLRYLKRDYIPFNSSTAAVIWNISEAVYAEGNKSLATLLWKLLTSKGGIDIPEVRYAHSRLNVQTTEIDDLWQN